MNAIVQCVPNISEGRDGAVVEAVADAARSVEGVAFLGVESDADHHRSVLTFLGPPEAVSEAAFRVCAAAKERIDLRRHSGQHPRMGATDVVPFIPVRGVSMADCAALAAKTGERVAMDLGIPVYLYGEAARDEKRRNLAWVRKGEFEGLSETIGKDLERTPDFGPARIHESAGATAVGARFFLIAYNVNLRTTDAGLAKSIARAIRASSGGLPHVKALGLTLAEKSMVQVSMNLTDYRVTSMARVFREIEARAVKAGVEVAGSELIGFAPSDALVRSAAELMQLDPFEPKQVLENNL